MLFPVDMNLDSRTESQYRSALRILQEADVPFLVGGAYAFGAYSGIMRDTKDLDLFLKPADVERALAVFAERGLPIERTNPLWIAKAILEDGLFVDLIFRSGNLISEVDDDWFVHGPEATVIGVPVQLCPAEECLWQKAFIMERERYDGADVAHYLLARAEQMDWPRLLTRFGPDWQVLLSHLLLFRYIYPGEAHRIPPWVMEELLARVSAAPEVPEDLCRGPLLSRIYSLVAVDGWGYGDVRFQPDARFSPDLQKAWREVVRQDTPSYRAVTGITRVMGNPRTADKGTKESAPSHEANSHSPDARPRRSRPGGRRSHRSDAA